MTVTQKPIFRHVKVKTFMWAIHNVNLQFALTENKLRHHYKYQSLTTSKEIIAVYYKNTKSIKTPWKNAEFML